MAVGSRAMNAAMPAPHSRVVATIPIEIGKFGD
jgi:hypothetical protein